MIFKACINQEITPEDLEAMKYFKFYNDSIENSTLLCDLPKWLLKWIANVCHFIIKEGLDAYQNRR